MNAGGGPTGTLGAPSWGAVAAAVGATRTAARSEMAATGVPPPRSCPASGGRLLPRARWSWREAACSRLRPRPPAVIGPRGPAAPGSWSGPAAGRRASWLGARSPFPPGPTPATPGPSRPPRRGRRHPRSGGAARERPPPPGDEPSLVNLQAGSMAAPASRERAQAAVCRPIGPERGVGGKGDPWRPITTRTAARGALVPRGAGWWSSDSNRR
jgi:hypothetical protein